MVDNSVIVAAISVSGVVIVGYFNLRATRKVSRDIETPGGNGHTIGTSAGLVEDMVHSQGKRLDTVEVLVQRSKDEAVAAVADARQVALEASGHAEEAASAVRATQEQLTEATDVMTMRIEENQQYAATTNALVLDITSKLDDHAHQLDDHVHQLQQHIKREKRNDHA